MRCRADNDGPSESPSRRLLARWGLYNEKDQANAAAGKEDRYYVWKITDQGLVKQYVILYKTTVISENKLVLSGLSEGDKIAIEGN